MNGTTSKNHLRRIKELYQANAKSWMGVDAKIRKKMLKVEVEGKYEDSDDEISAFYHMAGFIASLHCQPKKISSLPILKRLEKLLPVPSLTFLDLLVIYDLRKKDFDTFRKLIKALGPLQSLQSLRLTNLYRKAVPAGNVSPLLENCPRLKSFTLGTSVLEFSSCRHNNLQVLNLSFSAVSHKTLQELSRSKFPELHTLELILVPGDVVGPNDYSWEFLETKNFPELKSLTVGLAGIMSEFPLAFASSPLRRQLNELILIYREEDPFAAEQLLEHANAFKNVKALILNGSISQKTRNKIKNVFGAKIRTSPAGSAGESVPVCMQDGF